MINTLLIQKNLLASHDEIGWWDEGEHTDELRDITLDDINYLLREFDGYIDIEYDEDEVDEEEEWINKSKGTNYRPKRKR